MNDDVFERDVRAMLAGRDPGPAPARLSEAVRAQRSADRGPRRIASAGRWAGTIAVLGAVAAVVVLAIVVARPISVGPGATPLPTPIERYSIQPGDGVITEDHTPAAQEIAALLAFAGLFVVVRIASDRRARIGAALGIALILLVTVRIGTSDAIGFGVGVLSVDPGGSGPADPSGTYVSVRGDRPFTVLFTVTNTSRLPLTIEGIPEPGSQVINGRTQPRLVGLGLVTTCCPAAGMQPFRPVTLQPAGSVDLVIGGMAGDCAIPGDAPGGTRFVSFEQVSVVYEQLTIWHTAEVTLPESVVVQASGADCP
jgi:hypothetical protein